MALANHTLFHKRVRADFRILILYVNDMIMTGSNFTEIEKRFSYLVKKFEMKDLGFLNFFLGIKVSLSKQGLFFLQRNYILFLGGY